MEDLATQGQTGNSASAVMISQADDDGHLIALWLRGKSPNTLEAYERDVGQFIDFADLSLHDVKLQDLWNWAESLNGSGLTTATIARKLASVKSLFSFGHRIGYLTFNIGAAVSAPRVPDLLAERILSEPDVQRILIQQGSLRDVVLLRLFYASGARVSELANLYWKSVQERGNENGRVVGQVTLLGKGDKTRSVLLSPDTWDMVGDLKKDECRMGYGAPEDPAFRSRKGGALSRQQIWRVVKSAAKNAGLEQAVSPHWLRHAHASHALDRGAPMHLVKETLGHKSLATTSKYTHARPDDSSARYLGI